LYPELCKAHDQFFVAQEQGKVATVSFSPVHTSAVSLQRDAFFTFLPIIQAKLNENGSRIF